MVKKIIVTACCILSLGHVTFTNAQDKPMNGNEILSKVDDVLYAAKDKDMQIKFTLTDKNGKESIREVLSLEKGEDKRMMKFVSPADQKGIGFLSLPNDMMYLYLPAFGKTRRIATHVKNTKFAGTDLTYENLEAKRYTSRWNADLSSQDATTYVLTLSAKPGTVTDYSKLVVTVVKEGFLASKIEYYNKSGALAKVMTRSNFKKFGTYTEAMDLLMEDLKDQHKTRLQLVSVKHDTNIPDANFTERYLAQ